MTRIGKHAIALVPGAVFVLAVLAAIEVAARSGVVNASVVPAPTTVAVAFYNIITSGVFLKPVAQTLSDLFIGYAAGCALGIVLGILMGSFRSVYNLFEPLTEMLRPIPKPALLPALMLFLGLGGTMKITLVALAAFFPVLVSSVQGTRGVDATMIDMARTFGYDPAQILLRIVLPAASPYFAVGMRVSLGISLVVIIAAEMLATNGGVGSNLITMQQQFQVRQTYGWLVVLALIGFLLNAVFAWAERRLTFWSAPS